MRLRPRNHFPRTEIVGRTRKRAYALGGKQMRLDRARDAACNLVLHRKYIANLAVVMLGPMVAAAHRIDELGGNTQAAPGTADAAFEHVANTKRSRDLVHAHGALLVDEGGVSRDHEQPADM